jgi:hypothetical protein
VAAFLPTHFKYFCFVSVNIFGTPLAASAPSLPESVAAGNAAAARATIIEHTQAGFEIDSDIPDESIELLLIWLRREKPQQLLRW